MEKQLAAAGYWLGLSCTIIALIFRILSAFNVTALNVSASGGNAIGYLSFFRAAGLFSCCRLRAGAGLENLRSEPPQVSDSIAEFTGQRSIVLVKPEPTLTERKTANSSRVLSPSKRSSIPGEKGSAASFKTA